MIRKHPIRNIALPIALLVPLVWMMTGCLYIPFFEHRIDSGPNVRALVGNADSDRPIRPGHVTKAQVIALLGEAPWISYDGNALGYLTRTSMGSWVWPLCFTAEPADSKTYVVRLVFDKQGDLVHYDWADASRSIPLIDLVPPRLADEFVAVAKLNEHGPALHPARQLH